MAHARTAVPSTAAPITSAPQDPGPTPWAFPESIEVDDDDGCVALGADLAPSTLVHAYRNGLFPWPHEGVPLPWFSPDPRGVLPLDRVKVSRSLRQTLRRSGWETTIDAALPEVLTRCAERPGEGTWINTDMRLAYLELHRLGWVHSVEVWDGDELVGGLYGVLVGGVFTGESMFHRATDASKVALLELAARMHEARGSLIDVQLVTEHLASLGAIPIARPLFLELLRELRDDPVRLRTDRRPVSLLADLRVEIEVDAPPAGHDVDGATPGTGRSARA